MADDGVNVFDVWILEHLFTTKITAGDEGILGLIKDMSRTEGGRRSAVLENLKIQQRLHLRSARRTTSDEEWKECFEMLEFLQGSNKGMRLPNELSISIRVHACLQCVQPDVQPDVQPVAFGTIVEQLFPESPSSSAEENRVRAKLLAASKSMELLAQLNESYPKELLTENLRKYFSSIDSILGPSFLQIVQTDVEKGRNTAAAYNLRQPPVEVDISQPQATPEVNRKRPREGAEDEGEEEYADAEDTEAAVDAQADQRIVQIGSPSNITGPREDDEADEEEEAVTEDEYTSAEATAEPEAEQDFRAATRISVAQPGDGTVATVQWSEASQVKVETSQDDQISKVALELANVCRRMPQSLQAPAVVLEAAVVSPLGREIASPRDAGGSRRRNLRWSKEEEEGFKLLVNTFGVGSWKKVLTTGQAQGVIVDTRTEVDLKDKWRNMQRKEAV